MEKLFHLVLIAICITFSGCGVAKELEETKPEKTKDTNTIEEADTVLQKAVEKVDKEALLRQKMKDEVIALWTLYLQDHDAPDNDSRWEYIDRFSNSLVKYVRKYQKEGTDHLGDTVYLPEHENVHLLVATMATFETALWHDAVGSMGEVGLLQVHGVALNGFKPSDVIRNPDLGLRLGIRWLTKQIPYCDVPSGREWTDDDWLGPLSVYGGGSNRAIRNGRCLFFKVSKRRIEYTKFYRDRINSKYST